MQLCHFQVLESASLLGGVEGEVPLSLELCFPPSSKTRLILLLSQILLGISCFQYETCQDGAINPKGSALLSSVLLISPPGNIPMLCLLSSQMHFTALVVPLSLLCILVLFLISCPHHSECLVLKGVMKRKSISIPLPRYSSCLSFTPLPLHISNATSLRSMLGFLAADWYCIGFYYPSFYLITLTTSVSSLRLISKLLQSLASVISMSVHSFPHSGIHIWKQTCTPTPIPLLVC